LNRYFTKEFFREAKKLLRPGGVFVIGATSTPGLKGVAVANRNATIYHTLDAVFARVLTAGDRFMYFFATDESGLISVDAATLAGRYKKRKIEAKGFSPQHYYLLLQEHQLQRVNWIVRNHGRSPGAYLAGAKRVPLNPGSLTEQEAGEHLAATALREVAEETGLSVRAPALADWRLSNRFEIFPEWRHRYGPGVTHNTEHVFSLVLPDPVAVTLSREEHRDWQWLPWQDAADACFSWTNRDAILMLPRLQEDFGRSS